MKTLLAMLFCLLSGCAPFIDAQSSLLIEARRGIELAQSNRGSVSGVYAQLAKLKRQRLDAAFDADVREHEREEALSADWVIDHRAAYAAALDAYATENAQLRASDDVARRNLDATDAALARLQWLQSIQNRWLKLPEETK